MDPTVFERLSALLDTHRVRYEVTRHAPVFTSEQAAQVRGVPLSSGAKALVCKAGDRFVLFVMPADRRLASGLARRAVGVRGLRFATRDEVSRITTLTPGAIPPFGQLFGLPTYCEAALQEQPRIHFNAGDHAISVSLATRDYLAVERPILGAFTEL